MTPPHLDPDTVPEWLASLWPAVGRDARIVAGINDDDCAVIKWGDTYLVLTLDFLNSRPIATQLGLGGLADLGRLLVAANLADLCGTGADPQVLLTGVTLERKASEADFQALMRGVHSEAQKWNVPVVGGDTKLGSHRALVATAIGFAPDLESLFLKTAGRAGHLLWCSGQLGSCNAAAIGLVHRDMPLPWKQWAREAILTPNLPLTKSRAMSQARLGKAGIDISDGLGGDLDRLCKASRVGALVEVDQIPVHTATRDLAESMEIAPWAFAFGCGGDCQFLVSTTSDARPEAMGMGFTLIGELTEDPAIRMRLPTGAIVSAPVGGHRDVRDMPFSDEILDLVRSAANSTRS